MVSLWETTECLDMIGTRGELCWFPFAQKLNIPNHQPWKAQSINKRELQLSPANTGTGRESDTRCLYRQDEEQLRTDPPKPLRCRDAKPLQTRDHPFTGLFKSQ